MPDVKHDSREAPLSPKQATPSARAARRETRARILTVLLSLLLLDAAVETFSSGAPVRWRVAGVVAAYLGLAVVVRPRVPDTLVSWSRLATASVFVLLGLLAWTGLAARRVDERRGHVAAAHSGGLVGGERIRRCHRGWCGRPCEVPALVGTHGLRSPCAVTVSRPSSSGSWTGLRTVPSSTAEACGDGCLTGCRARSSVRS